MNDESIRLALRLTARLSLVFFLWAFVAEPLNHRWPVRLTNWLDENQRWAALGLAGSHSLHLAAIIALERRLGWDLFLSQVHWSAIIGGGLGYVAIYGLAAAAMLPSRAGWFGSRRFQVPASYWVWFIFALSYVGGSFQSPQYAPVGAAVLAALVVRVMPESKLRPAVPRW
jgi:hypothetical protein